MTQDTLTCVRCQHAWASDPDTTRKALAAARSNKEGPYCGLCLHIEMAERYAAARGLTLTIIRSENSQR